MNQMAISIEIEKSGKKLKQKSEAEKYNNGEGKLTRWIQSRVQQQRKKSSILKIGEGNY